MDREAPRPKSRRKLNRSQITEILERNVQLYKDEENFVHYLVDLAVYLLEYEYDWVNAGSRPWMGKAPGAEGAADNQTPAGDIPPNPNMPPPPHMMPPPPPPESGSVKSKRTTLRGPTFDSLKLNQRLCPYCGSIVGDSAICPSCRNVTR